MKRNMSLIRELLFVAEADGDDSVLCEKYGREVVAGHVALLLDAELVKGCAPCGQNNRPIASVITRLTWKGHEFLDNARNDTVWKRVTGVIKEKSVSVSFEVLTELLKSSVVALVAG